MPTTLQLRPLVFARQRGGGGAYAFPIADPDLVARGVDLEDAIAKLGAFLAQHLQRIPAGMLARFVYPPDAELRNVAVCLPRPDLPRRVEVKSPVAVPCVVIADRGAQWVHVVPLAHTLYVPAEETDPSRRIVAEIERLVAAREPSPMEYLSLLPGSRHELRALEVQVSRDGLDDLGRRAGERRKREADRSVEAARKVLAAIGTDRLASATKLPPVLHRDTEIRTLAGLLGGDERLCVAIVGERRAGKTAVLDGLLSQRVVPFRSHPVFATSGAQLVAGQSGFGQLEQRIHDVMAAAERLDAVLYFDDLGDLLAGHSGSIEDMASAMRPYIVEGRVRVVGELTAEQLEHFEKRQVGLFSAMHRLSVEPLDVARTRDVIEARAQAQRRREPGRPSLQPGAIAPLVQLAERYLGYEAFPGKAVQLADELRAIHEGEVDASGEPMRIGPNEVYAAFAARSGIPIFLLREDRSMRRDAVVDFFRRNVIGQAEAIDRIADTLCTVKAGLQAPSRPLANFLFIGPTGVGKTEVAKTLARFLFGSAERLVRFDMSEYMDPWAAERLIRGTERDEGELTRRVRQQPFCVVLLDEIEKAHRAVFDLLLQVCGEGRLSDARGRTTWFHNAIIIMTSNLGAALRRPKAGFGAPADASDAAFFVEQVQRNFRPEFVNRLDRVVPFAALDREEIRHVARVALQRLQGRDGIARRSIAWRVSDAALDGLAAAGFSEAYGARALRRHLEDALVGPLSVILAEAADLAERARVDVLAPEEVPPPSEEGWVDLVDRVVADLRFVVRRPAAGVARDTGHAVRHVAHLRRQAWRCLTLRPIEAMRERRDYLVAELARPTAGDAPMGAAVGDYDRLQRLLGGLDEAMAGLESAEDLCVAAQAEGEDSTAYVEAADEAFAAFERAFVAAALERERADAATVIVRPLPFGADEGRRRMREWIEGWMAYADAHQWQCALHRFQDPDPDSTWLSGLAWGPPRTRAWVLEALAGADDATLGKQWRAVVLRVRGPGAFGVLALEAGLHRFRLGVEQTQLDIRVILPTFDVDEATWRSDRLSLAYAPTDATASKAAAVREFEANGTVGLPALGQVLDVGWADYFGELARVHFSLLAQMLAREEEED